MKPFLYKNYTITKVGINKVNTDIHNLISKLDKAIKNKQEKDSLELKNKNNHSQTISSISTTSSLQSNISNNYNINDNKKENNNRITKIKNKLIDNEDIIFENEGEINEKNVKKTEINKESSVNKRISFFNSKNIIENNNGQKSKNISIFREMASKYIDKDEIELKNIERSQNKKIKLIDIDLLLKKISENFLIKKKI